jgi:hypothetical protein
METEKLDIVSVSLLQVERAGIRKLCDTISPSNNAYICATPYDIYDKCMNLNICTASLRLN